MCINVFYWIINSYKTLDNYWCFQLQPYYSLLTIIQSYYLPRRPIFYFHRGITICLLSATTHILLQQMYDNLSVFVIIFTDNVRIFYYQTVSKSPKQMPNGLTWTKSSVIPKISKVSSFTSALYFKIKNDCYHVLPFVNICRETQRSTIIDVHLLRRP